MTIDLTAMPKDCDCIIHEGLHWLHVDRMSFEQNLRILARGGRLRLHAYAQAEEVRLRDKRFAMMCYTRDETESFIFPDGYRERDYEAERTALLDRLIAEEEASR